MVYGHSANKLFLSNRQVYGKPCMLYSKIWPHETKVRQVIIVDKCFVERSH